jgi:hypothetical protein
MGTPLMSDDQEEQIRVREEKEQQREEKKLRKQQREERQQRSPLKRRTKAQVVASPSQVIEEGVDAAVDAAGDTAPQAAVPREVVEAKARQYPGTRDIADPTRIPFPSRPRQSRLRALKGLPASPRDTSEGNSTHERRCRKSTLPASMLAGALPSRIPSPGIRFNKQSTHVEADKFHTNEQGESPVKAVGLQSHAEDLENRRLEHAQREQRKRVRAQKESAATSIQASVRGKQARLVVEEKKEAAWTKQRIQSQQQEDAATSIQASVRGKQARETMGQRNQQEVEAKATDEYLSEAYTRAEEEEQPIDVQKDQQEQEQDQEQEQEQEQQEQQEQEQQEQEQQHEQQHEQQEQEQEGADTEDAHTIVEKKLNETKQAAAKGSDTEDKHDESDDESEAESEAEEEEEAEESEEDESEEEEEGEDEDDGDSEHFRERLAAFYTQHNPAKLGSVESTLKSYAGREDVLFKKLAAKYEVEVP